ncbi:MAG: class I SAM-dependent methyltransferase [Anaerolineae bacterium]|nr:class I SAM-dependent methyltransferase [Anaerolineae bacterium]
MKTNPFLFDEFTPTGADYTDMAEVAVYDERMSNLRNPEAQAREILELLKVNEPKLLVEFGPGTGAFAIEAARQFEAVVAVDTSAAMLSYARQKAQAQNINNITFVKAGFLSYRHHHEPADAIVTNMALHHVPDAWKFVAFRNMARILKPGGKLFLGDVVFSFAIDEFEHHTHQFVASIKETAGPELAAEAQTHICREFSTFDWIIEGMLARVGLSVEILNKEPLFARYLCTKK